MITSHSYISFSMEQYQMCACSAIQPKRGPTYHLKKLSNRGNQGGYLRHKFKREVHYFLFLYRGFIVREADYLTSL